MKLKKLISWKKFGTKSVNYFLATILLIGVVTSCGTRKVELEKLEGIEVNNTYSNGSKIILGTNVKFVPFDNSKPYKVDGKEYSNVIVTNEKIKIVERWNTKTIYQTKTIYKSKLTEKSDNTILYIGIAFIICLFIFLWFYLPKLPIRQPL